MSLVRILKTIVITVILSGLAVPVISCASNSTAANPSPAPQRQVVAVKRGDLASYITAVGNTAFAHTQDLTFTINGRAVEVNAKDGDIVTKGQVLARYDNTDRQRTLDTDELAVKSAEISLQDAKDAEANITAAQIDLDQATDDLRKITYPYTYSTFAYDVPKALDFINSALRQMREAQKGIQTGLTPEQYYEASHQLKQALDNLTDSQQLLARGQGADVFGQQTLAVKDFWTVRTAQLAVDKAQSTLDKTRSSFKSGVDKANVALQSAISDRDSAKEDLAKGIIAAPFNAVVTMVNIYSGDEWKSGQVAFSVAELNKFETDVMVSEADIPWIKEGEKIALQLDVAGATISGTVTRIALTATVYRGAANYKVQITVDSPSADAAKPVPVRTPGQLPGDNAVGDKPNLKPTAMPLRQGLSVTASILKEERKGVLLVPSQAVTRQGDSTSVQVLNGTNIEQRAIKTGLSDPQSTEITQGLSEGDKVVLPGGTLPIRPGGTSR